jgi:dienelactone hydrolase
VIVTTGVVAASGAATLGGGGASLARSSTTPQPSYAVGLRTLTLTDTSRTIRLSDGRKRPRTLLTYVRYPALGAPGATDVRNAPPAGAGAPYPLIVFAHGFDITPAPYGRLLQSWARAGYVVAAPVFPLSNADAPGGPEETDVVNQPRDVSFVISSLLSLAATRGGPLSSLVDPRHVGVAGHSDGGETALAVGYGRRLRDPRVSAVVVLAGAEMSGVGGYAFPAGSPPLFAAQGTADTFNEPRYTYEYFERAHRPKYLLRLLGAEHLPPYTDEQPQLTIVERETLAFFDRYLDDAPVSLSRMLALGDVPGDSTLRAEP